MYQRERLFSRLGHFAYQSFVEATKLCRTFRHEYVELEHWLKVLVDKERGDLPMILAHYAINSQRISDALDRILHTLPNRTNAVVDLSTQLETVVERGLLMSQLAETPSGGVRTIHILVGILQDPTLQRSLYRLSDEFKKLPIPQLFDDYPAILAESVEHEEEEEEVYSAHGDAPEASETVDILDKWCADLTRQARDGEIDPVIGREAELRQVIDILLRRRQNNPILVGEAGVGKTAVAEALACKIAQGQVPPLLQGARLLSLDLGRMQAGASMRGEFESRLKALIDAIAHSAVPVILFCDEAHTLVGAGGQAGKRALVRDQIALAEDDELVVDALDRLHHVRAIAHHGGHVPRRRQIRGHLLLICVGLGSVLRPPGHLHDHRLGARLHEVPGDGCADDAGARHHDAQARGGAGGRRERCGDAELQEVAPALRIVPFGRLLGELAVQVLAEFLRVGEFADASPRRPVASAGGQRRTSPPVSGAEGRHDQGSRAGWLAAAGRRRTPPARWRRRRWAARASRSRSCPRRSAP